MTSSPSIRCLVLVLLSVTACGRGDRKPPTAETPEQAARLMLEAIEARDAERMWALFSDSERGRITSIFDEMTRDSDATCFELDHGVKQREVATMTPKQKFVALTRALSRPREGLVLRMGDVHEVSDRTATVAYSLGDQRCSMSVARTGDGWRVDGVITCQGGVDPLFEERARPGQRHYQITSVAAGGDAESKLRVRDLIVAVGGTPVFEGIGPSLGELVAQSGGAPLELSVLRDWSAGAVDLNKAISVTVKPALDESVDPPSYRLGIAMTSTRVCQ